ncbi:MAG: amidohydrolase family protein [Planctomycetota bacterium]|nr:amidohydrolase family protein [Planctomycetota bacterium]
MRRQSIILTAIFGLALAAATIHPGAADEPPGSASAASFCLQAARILPISGEPIENGMIWIENGKIRAIGKKLDLPDGVEVRNLGKSVIMPGLVDGHSHLGGYFDLAETVTASTPGMRAADALDPFHPSLGAALRDGITCHLLAPRGDNTIAGVCAVIKPSSGEGGARVLTDEAGLKLSFSSGSLRRDRRPTSRAGAVALFREKAASNERSDELGEALAGRWPVFVDASSRGEIATALRVIKEFQLRGALVHASWGRDLAEEILDSGLACVIGPLQMTDPREVLETAGALEGKGVKVAFGSDAPIGTRDSLLVTAALAVRHGMSRRAALRALTINAAELAGVSDQLGSLEAGKSADLLIMDGDPLDLSSRVEEVFLDGESVYRRKKAKEKP